MGMITILILIMLLSTVVMIRRTGHILIWGRQEKKCTLPKPIIPAWGLWILMIQIPYIFQLTLIHVLILILPIVKFLKEKQVITGRPGAGHQSPKIPTNTTSVLLSPNGMNTIRLCFGFEAPTTLLKILTQL